MTFEDYLKTLDFDRLVQLWNEFCYSSDGSADDIIYDSIEDIHAQMDMDGFDIARALFFGDVKGWNDRVSFNGYGNLYSVYNLENSPIVISYLAKWLKDEEHEVYDEWCVTYVPDNKRSSKRPIDGLVWDEYGTY
jgi:hypothetical protein